MKKFVALAALGLAALFVAPPSPAAAQRIGGIGGIGRIGGIGGFGRIGGIGRVGPISAYSGTWSPRVFGRTWRAASYYPSAGYYGWAPRVLRIGWGGYGPSYWSAPPRFYRRAWRAGYYYPNEGVSYCYPSAVYYP
jgi:hypothetical protein